MRRRVTPLIILICTLALASHNQAQIPQLSSPTENDPLHRVQTPSTAACTTDASSSCAEVAAKILPLILGPSPMQENLRRLTDEIGGRVTGSAAMERAVPMGHVRISSGRRRRTHRKISTAADLERRRHPARIASAKLNSPCARPV